MGEYATLISNKERVKIGTCESMYYLRFEDVDKVEPIDGNVNPATDWRKYTLRFRLPFPDEDGVNPGYYQDYNRGVKLYQPPRDKLPMIPFTDKETADDPGTIQLSHKCGLLANLPCYHGEILPASTPPVSIFWNGKDPANYELRQIRPVLVDGKQRVFPVVFCRWCEHAWRYEWADIWDFIPDPELKGRLEKYR